MKNNAGFFQPPLFFYDCCRSEELFTFWQVVEVFFTAFSRIKVARRLLRGMVKSISRGESLSQLDLLGIVGDAEGHEGKGPKIWPTFGLNYVKSIQFWTMNWQCFGNVFTIVTWLPNWKALTDWPTFWKAKKLHFGQRHLWLISNLLSGKIGYDLFNEKWIVS